MPKINLLPKNVAELIAAGEVVERPASVIKELVENSIDAGATVITVEIQRGGIGLIRVTDNGCGIAFEDVPTAFLRHATSKIKTDSDLDAIATLGFRGEALAAVSSVARVEMLTATEDSIVGTHYKIEGSEEILYEESGCPKGTTIVIKDIFYNTPARMKFLKKDVSEGNACAAVIDRIALSHPEISFRFIRDSKQTLSTSGDGEIKSAIYSVLGREFSASLIETSGEMSGVSVSGYICKPIACKPTRNSQYTFLNGRLVRSGTVVAAVEQAYKNSAMVGKFPSFVIYINIPFEIVDVNVHPAKTEVRFSDEKRIFDAVYSAIKNALISGDTRPQVKLNTPAFDRFKSMTTEEYRQQTIDIKPKQTIAEQIYSKPITAQNITKPNNSARVVFKDETKPSFADRYSFVSPEGNKTEPMTKEEYTKTYVQPKEEKVDIIPEPEEKEPIIVIGEAFSTYIIAQMGSSIFMIDKHAAHERILFNELKQNKKIEVQSLLSPLSVTLSREEYDAIITNTDILEKSGFEIEDFGNSTVLVRAIPVFLTKSDITSVVSEVANSIIKSGKISTEKEEDLLHTIACRTAIKAGNYTNVTEMKALAEKVLYSEDIMYCPHGRPVAFEIKKRELEKQFGRIQ
ncbi:MAG: DNA mismatch repair endonuclease MutL [Clostridia bacterium]|nr:DNA mismatch repair endonuclease MutL [Clostridia bacterium]